MRKIASLVLAGVMSLGTVAATSTPAQAHVTVCSKQVSVPKRLPGYGNRISGYAHTKRPIDGHQRRCGVTSWVEVWAPNGRGQGAWRKIGAQDADWSSGSATAYPSSALLYGRNLYRINAEFWADGAQGSREKMKAGPPVLFNRMFVRR